MNILKRLKSMSNSIDYEKDICWYENNYVMLGSGWLYDTLKNKLQLKNDFSFLSPSANIGKYESDTYDNLRKDGYNPIFYLSDLNSGKLENKVKEREQFFWILGDEIDASEIKLSNRKEDGTVPIKFDVILDCKGAIWHGLNSAKKDLEEVVKLLNNYYDLLKKDDSVLLIDYGMPGIWRKMFDVYIKIIRPNKKVRKKKMDIHFMCEYTTYYYLYNYVEKMIKCTCFHPLELKMENNCKDKFDMSFCTKRELKQCIEKLNNVPIKQFIKYKRRNKCINNIYAGFSLFIVVFIFVVLILLCMGMLKFVFII